MIESIKNIIPLKEFSEEDRINSVLLSLPVIAAGLFRGGESAIFIQLLGIYLVLLITYFLFKSNKISIEKNIFFLPLSIFIFASFISTLFSESFYPSFVGFSEYLAYFLYFILLLIVKPNKKTIFFLIFLFCAFEALFSFFQISHGRVSGTYGYSNFFVVPLFFGLIYSYKKFENRFLKYFFIAIFLIGAILTGSRIVFVLLLILPFFIFRRKVLWFIVPVLITLFLIIPNPAGERIKGKVDIYSMQRPRIWKQAFKTGMDKPFTGWGLRNYEKASLKYNFPVDGDYSRKAKIAHNQFLQYFAEGGLVLLFSFILLFWVFIVNYRKLTEVGGLFILVILIHSLFDNSLYLPANFLLLTVVFYCSVDTSQEYSIEISKFLKFLFPLLSLIYLLPLLSGFYMKSGKKYFKEGNFVKAQEKIKIANILFPTPGNTDVLASINEQLYRETESVSFLYYSYYLHTDIIESDPIDWENYVNLYRFLKRNRGNIGINNPDKILEKALKLNPCEKSLYELLITEYQRQGRYEKAGWVKWKMGKNF